MLLGTPLNSDNPIFSFCCPSSDNNRLDSSATHCSFAERELRTAQAVMQSAAN
jgi:hypothetical protein